MGWNVTAEHLEKLAIGAGILGTGGGGNPYLGKLIARRFLDEGGSIEVVPLDEVADDALVCSVGGMGSPTVSFERLIRAKKPAVAMAAVGVTAASGATTAASMAARSAASRTTGARGPAASTAAGWSWYASSPAAPASRAARGAATTAGCG